MTDQPRRPAAAALVAAAALTVLAGVHATHGTFDDRLTTTADYLNDGSFTVALVALALAATGLRGAPAWALRCAVAGPLLVAVGVIAGLATGESPGWFAAVGVPGNLLWLAGTVALGRWAWRSGALPRPLALGVALTVPTALILAEIGGSAVAAVAWAAIGLRWLGAASRAGVARTRASGPATAG